MLSHPQRLFLVEYVVQFFSKPGELTNFLASGKILEHLPPLIEVLTLIIHQQTWEYYEAKRLGELVDPALGDYPEDEVIRYIKVALFCVQAAAARRPSMPQVLTMLSKPIRINESELTAPGYIHDYKGTASKATATSSKNSGSDDSNVFSTVVPPTISEMSPR
jgi:hypothetical protein